MKEIENYIESYFGLSNKDLSPVSDLFRNTSIKKNEFYLQEGKTASSLSFVRSGFLRIFALDEKGDKEVTQWISTAGTFVTDLAGLIFDAPSRFNIQALSDCELYTISKENYNKIVTLVPAWPALEKLFIAKCFITLENRMFGQLSKNAEQKVIELMELNPSLFNQVPLQYIASMLGMTPETLSRIRAKRIS